MSLESPATAALPGPAEILRGNWLNRRRLTVALWLCLGCAVWGVYALFGDARPPLDGAGRPLGMDFSALWAAGKAALAGDAASAYSLGWFIGHQNTLFGAGAQKLAWAYPPQFYVLLVPLAALPYGTALALWLAGTFAALALVVRGILASAARDPLLLLALTASPAVFGNAIHGQTAFLTAALLAGGLLALPTRPVLAGILFACLAYKPQYGPLIPLALAAGGYWRAFAAAAITGTALAIAIIVVFGIDIWPAFFAGLQEMRQQTLEAGRNGFHNMISIYGAARLYGLNSITAWVAQGLIALAVAAGTVWLWRKRSEKPVDLRLRAAGLIA
ncbi:MAG: DUF2029 domain-containing protein, partial [Hyphomicrobiales bacterium]|nr:DUF2029 domain-containing protein [Hyphomicrobiales bacterium]